MIEFGLFSSQLPYIIFIAVYMLYFGASSLIRHETETPALQSEFTKGHIAAVTAYDDKTLICKITSSVKSVAEKNTGCMEHFPGNFPSNVSFPRDNILHLPLMIGGPVFSRPPPFTSWI